MTPVAISEKQFGGLREQVLDAFFLRILEFLRQVAHDDVKSYDDASLLARIRDSYRIATAHGAVGEQAVVMWMCLEIMAGKDFHKIPGVRQLLDAPGETDMKLKQLFRRLSDLEMRRRWR